MDWGVVSAGLVPAVEILALAARMHAEVRSVWRADALGSAVCGAENDRQPRAVESRATG